MMRKVPLSFKKDKSTEKIIKIMGGGKYRCVFKGFNPDAAE